MLKYFFSGLALIVLGACSDGGGGGSATPISASIPIAGMGVKGPLSGALVTAYQVDPNAVSLKGDVLDTGTTDAMANIIDLEIPDTTTGLILLEFVADSDTVDLTTGLAPILTTLTTIVDPARVAAGDSIYASALTTLAVNVTSANAGSGGAFGGDDNADTSLEEVTAALNASANQVKSTLGFGLLAEIDIFTTPPVLTELSTDPETQGQVAAYRTAAEALVAVIANVQNEVIQSGSEASADDIMQGIVADLGDGNLDGQAGAEPIAEFNGLADLPMLLSQDPSDLPIPNTDLVVGDVIAVLLEEAASAGLDLEQTPIANSEVMTPDPAPAALETDSDGDQILDSLDNCIALANSAQEDADQDSQGDVCDDDDDNDDVADADDAFPLDADESVDTDADGTGNNADVDDDGDGTLDAVDAFPLDATETTDTDQDGIGNNADADDDADGSADVDDAFPLNPEESVDSDNDGIGNNADDDDDNDGVPDNLDQLPTDPEETIDTDADGIGNVADTDDDNDQVLDADDNCPLTANPNQADADGNGQGDACSSQAVWNQTNWDEANWQ